MVRRRQIGPQDEVSRFAPLLLHPLHQKTGIFAGAKAASLDGGEPLLAGQRRQLGLQCWAVVEGNGLTLLDDAIGDTVGEGGTFDDALYLTEHVVVERAVGAAGLTAQLGMIGDDVAAAASVKLADVDAGHAVSVAGNAEHGGGGHAGGCQRIAAGIGFEPRVGGGAHKVDVELGGAEKLGGVDHQLAAASVNADMEREQGIHVIECTTGSQRLATATPLFGGLEEELDATAQLLFHRHQAAGQPHADGGMAIVSAGVHPPLVVGGKTLLLRLVLFGVGLFHLHRIYVEAKGQGRAGTTGIQLSHQASDIANPLQPVGMGSLTTGASLLGSHIHITAHHQIAGQQLVAEHDAITELAQVVGNQAGGAKLFPGGFRQAVQVAAPQDQVLKGHLGFLGDSICRLLCLFSRLTTRGPQLVGGAVSASGGCSGRE